MQVDLLIHAQVSKNFRRGTLVGWLTDSVHVAHLEAEPISPVAQFYAEAAREEPLNGKWRLRRLEIYLASGEDVVGRQGLPKGFTKAACAATEGQPAAVPPPAAAEGRAAAPVLPPAVPNAGGSRASAPALPAA